MCHTKSRVVLIGWTIFVVAVACAAFAQSEEAAYDLLLRGGRIVDGSGNPWQYGDLALRGNKILAIGKLPPLKSRREIEISRRQSSFLQ